MNEIRRIFTSRCYGGVRGDKEIVRQQLDTICLGKTRFVSEGAVNLEKQTALFTELESFLLHSLSIFERSGSTWEAQIE